MPCEHDHEPTTNAVTRWLLRLLVAAPLLHAAYHSVAAAMGWPCP